MDQGDRRLTFTTLMSAEQQTRSQCLCTFMEDTGKPLGEGVVRERGECECVVREGSVCVCVREGSVSV